jgi:hypothetical protein
MKKTIRLSSFAEEQAIRAGDFSLMPRNPSPPYILSQPIKNFQQFTWIEGLIDGDVRYQNISPTFDTITMLKGTSFSFEIRVADPSNVNNPNDVTNLSFKWKRNEAPIYDLNRLNGGVGTPAALVEEQSSTPNLSGRYICEVSNQFGSIESAPFDVNIVDPLKHPLLYKNLLRNGDGDGGLDGWVASNDIKTQPFVNDTSLIKGFGSCRFANLALIDYNKETTGAVAMEFFFSNASHWGLFFNWYNKRLKNDPTMANINLTSTSLGILDDGERWISEGVIPQIVPNEDYSRSEFAAFFPGIAWMDQYNKNGNTIGLYSEMKDFTPTYFTRDKLKFLKFGGNDISTLSQTIDVSDLSDFVDGNVYGVKYSTAQFFAYVGAGITDYKIKVQTTEGEKIFNYNILDSEQMYDHIVQDKNAAFPVVFDEAQGRVKFTLIPGTPIEIIPQCYDRTSITLSFLDDRGFVKKEEFIDGPSELDLWAIKEKAFFPLTLFGLYQFIKPNNNDIIVFGQKYTNTDAIALLFDTEKSGIFSKGVDHEPYTESTLRDVAARFFVNKYDFVRHGTAYPGDVWYGKKYSQDNKFYYRALPDHGAAAMFGVGRDVIIPTKTRSIRVSVTFKHTSDILLDVDPNLKGWSDQEIYTNEYGQSTGVSRRLIEYGNPRCGITKMKLLIAPNDIGVSEEFASYKIPPQESTVLGLQKRRYQNPAAFNTADASTFTYTLIQPDGMPTVPAVNDPFILAKNLQSYINRIQEDNDKAAQLALDIPDAEMDEADILAAEDQDRAAGDYSLGLYLPENLDESNL